MIHSWDIYITISFYIFPVRIHDITFFFLFSIRLLGNNKVVMFVFGHAVVFFSHFFSIQFCTFYAIISVSCYYYFKSTILP